MSAWRRGALAAALLGLTAAYWIAWRAPAVGTFHDDGVYIVTAKALAEGKGYRIESLPSEIPQTKYPPLLPILLAGIWKWNPHFPQNVPWMKLVPLAFTVIWLLLSYRLLREEGLEDWIAAWICCLTAASTWVVYLGTMVLSEAPFAAFTTASLLLLRRAERTGSMITLAASAVCAGLAFQTRTLGMALLLSGPLYLLMRRKWREALVFCWLAGLIALPWVWWVMSQPPSPGVVDAYYSKENYQGWNIFTSFALPEKINILLSNLIVVLFAPGILAGVPTGGWLALPALAVGIVCFSGMWPKRSSPHTLLLAVYGAIVCAWAWIPSRFVVPFFPLLLWLGVEQLRTRPRVRAWTMALLTVASAGSLTYGLAGTLRLGYPPLPTPVAETDGWDKLETLLRQAKHTPPDAVLVGNLDPLYYLYTGRKAVRGFAAEPYRLIYAPPPVGSPDNPLGAADRFLEGLRRTSVTHWVDSPNSAFAEGVHLRRMLDELQRRYPQSFEPAPGADHTHRLYRLH